MIGMADEKPTSKKKVEYPDTPSGKALAAVGNIDGEDTKVGEEAAALAHGEAYQAEKRKHRWG